MRPDIPDIEPLTLEERARALDDIAARIHRYRLETPVTLLLEASRPLAGLTGMASFLATPLFGAFVGLDRAERYATLLGDPEAFDEVIERLERYRALPNKRDVQAGQAAETAEPAPET